MIPLTTLTVGYPEDMSHVSDRLPVDAIMHHGHYTQYTDSDIRRIYAEKESLDESKKFVAENAKQTLAQVYADVRYPREGNETFSAVLADFLKEYLNPTK